MTESLRTRFRKYLLRHFKMERLVEINEFYTIECRMDQFSKLPEKGTVCSQTFQFAGGKWYIKVHPNGHETGDVDTVGWISLYLCNVSLPNKISVGYRIGIKNCDGSMFKSFRYSDAFEHGDQLGSPYFMKRSDLLQSKYFETSGGSLRIFCTLDLCDKTIDFGDKRTNRDALSEISPPTTLKNIPQKSEHRETELIKSFSSMKSDETLTHHFRNLLLSGTHADVKVKVKEQVFEAHKCVLAARSVVFAAMFEHEMSERGSGVVDISDPQVHPDSFWDFLIFLYSGALDHVTPVNAAGLYRTADKYDTKELKNACVTCMNGNLMLDSICDVICLATQYDESELLTAASDFFASNTRTILQTNKWKDFISENPLIANELFIKVSEKNN